MCKNQKAIMEELKKFHQMSPFKKIAIKVFEWEGILDEQASVESVRSEMPCMIDSQKRRFFKGADTFFRGVWVKVYEYYENGHFFTAYAHKKDVAKLKEFITKLS